MMALLQWPSWSISPSRNQTPGAICFTVLGCASPRVRKKPSESVSRKLLTSHRRMCFIVCDSIQLGVGVHALVHAASTRLRRGELRVSATSYNENSTEVGWQFNS